MDIVRLSDPHIRNGHDANIESDESDEGIRFVHDKTLLLVVGAAHMNGILRHVVEDGVYGL